MKMYEVIVDGYSVGVMPMSPAAVIECNEVGIVCKEVR